MDTQSTNLG